MKGGLGCTTWGPPPKKGGHWPPLPPQGGRPWITVPMIIRCWTKMMTLADKDDYWPIDHCVEKGDDDDNDDSLIIAFSPDWTPSDSGVGCCPLHITSNFAAAQNPVELLSEKERMSIIQVSERESESESVCVCVCVHHELSNGCWKSWARVKNRC